MFHKYGPWPFFYVNPTKTDRSFESQYISRFAAYAFIILSSKKLTSIRFMHKVSSTANFKKTSFFFYYKLYLPVALTNCTIHADRRKTIKLLENSPR